MKQPELGLFISKLRKEKGLTQEELVEMCTINVRTIQRIEAGEVSPRSYTVKNILEALGANIEKLVEQVDPTTSKQVLGNKNIVLMGAIAGCAYLIAQLFNSIIVLTKSITGHELLGIHEYVTLLAVKCVLTCVFYGAVAYYASALGSYPVQVAAIVFAAMSFLFAYYDYLGFQQGVFLSSAFTVFSLLMLFTYGLLYIALGTAFFMQRQRLGVYVKWVGLTAIIGGIGYATLLLFPVGMLATLTFEVLLLIALLDQYLLHKKSTS
jgi:transcriptional regulator with XRE-family HTH domain